MGVYALDHIVLNVADVEQSLGFYQDHLGLAPERVDAWRRGDVRFPSLRVSESTIIDLVPAPPDTNGGGANLAHFCLVTDRSDLETAAQELTQAGIKVEQGPRMRSGARGDALSICFRDPDDN